jgi:hypothetical protein
MRGVNKVIASCVFSGGNVNRMGYATPTALSLSARCCNMCCSSGTSSSRKLRPHTYAVLPAEC